MAVGGEALGEGQRGVHRGHMYVARTCILIFYIGHVGTTTRSGPASSQLTIPFRSSSVARPFRLGRASSARAATPGRG